MTLKYRKIVNYKFERASVQYLITDNQTLAEMLSSPLEAKVIKWWEDRAGKLIKIEASVESV